jgi:hypothetical protein
VSLGSFCIFLSSGFVGVDIVTVIASFVMFNLQEDSVKEEHEKTGISDN